MPALSALIPLNMTRLDELNDAAELAQKAKALLDLSEAQLAALELARAFLRHPRLTGLSIHKSAAPARHSPPTLSPGGLSWARVESNLTDELFDARRRLGQADELDSGFDDLQGELHELSIAQRAAEGWIHRLSHSRRERLFETRFERVEGEGEAELIARAMRAILSEPEFSAWQAGCLEQAACPASSATARRGL